MLADKDGYVERISTRDLGIAIISLGGGRTRAGDAIDHTVGLTRLVAVGDAVKQGEPLAYIHAQSENDLAIAERTIKNSYSLSEVKPHKSALILERITPDHQ